MIKRVRIRRISPFSLGKILAVIEFVIGLLIAIPLALFAWLMTAGLPYPTAQEDELFFWLFFSGWPLLFMPLIYAMVGFVLGVVSGFVYNMVARIVGGLELEVEGEFIPQEPEESI